MGVGIEDLATLKGTEEGGEGGKGRKGAEEGGRRREEPMAVCLRPGAL